jgi:hypothetical protein
MNSTHPPANHFHQPFRLIKRQVVACGFMLNVFGVQRLRQPDAAAIIDQAVRFARDDQYGLMRLRMQGESDCR